MQGTWKTTSGGGDGIGPLIGLAAIIVAIAWAIKAMTPALHTAGETLRALAELAIAITAGLTLLVVSGGLVLFRWRKHHPPKAPPWRGTFRAQVLPPATRPTAPPASVPPMAALPPPAARAGDVHLHFHNMDPAQVAEAIRQAQQHPRPPGTLTPKEPANGT